MSGFSRGGSEEYHQVEAIRKKLIELREQAVGLREKIEHMVQKTSEAQSEQARRARAAAEQRVSKHGGKVTRYQLSEAGQRITPDQTALLNLNGSLNQAKSTLQTVSAEMKEVEAELQVAVKQPVSDGCDPTLWLPDELIIMILVRAPFTKLWSGTCCRVCRRWHRLAKSVTVQRHLRNARWRAYAKGWIKPKTVIAHTDDIRGLVNGGVYALAVQDNTLYTACKEIAVRALPSGRLIRTLVGHETVVRSLALGQDGNVYSGSWDSTAKVWSGVDGSLMHTVQFSDWVTALVIGPSGTVYCGLYSGDICAWSTERLDAKDQIAVQNLGQHQSGVVDIAVAPNGTVFSSASDNTVRVWSNDGALLKEHVTETMVRCLVCDPALGLVFYGTSASKIELRRPCFGGDMELDQSLCGHSDDVLAIACDWQGKKLFSGALDSTLVVWSRDKAGTMVPVQKIRKVECSFVACTTNGTVVTASISSDRLHIF